MQPNNKGEGPWEWRWVSAWREAMPHPGRYSIVLDDHKVEVDWVWRWVSAWIGVMQQPGRCSLLLVDHKGEGRREVGGRYQCGEESWVPLGGVAPYWLTTKVRAEALTPQRFLLLASISSQDSHNTAHRTSQP